MARALFHGGNGDELAEFLLFVALVVVVSAAVYGWEKYKARRRALDARHLAPAPKPAIGDEPKS
jgi:hypothetical protein